MTLFLDANAHLPLHPKALQAFVEYNNGIGGHGHAMSSSVLGRTASTALEDARAKIAHLIGAEPQQVFFTSSCTQACEWGLEILASRHFELVYKSTVEHKSVAEKASLLFGNNDLTISKQGMINCTFNPYSENSAMVCIHVQNELGTLQPIENIQVPFFSDMSQSLGKIPVNVSRIPNLKIATFGSHKFGGPVSVSILYLQDPAWWQPFGSGSRYRNDRPGTPDVGSCVATAVALEEAIKTLPSRYEKALAFRSSLEGALVNAGLEIIAEKGTRVPYTTFVKIGKKMAPYVMTQLESENIYVGMGSACGSVYSNSPIMTALGQGGKAQDYLRVSQWGDYGHNEGVLAAKKIIKYSPKPGSRD